MIYIVHGTNVPVSRKLILNQQKKLGDISKVELNVLDITPDDLYTHLHSSDMFGNFPFVVLDVSKAGRKKLDNFYEIVKETPKKATIIILSNKSLSKRNIWIKNAKELEAKVTNQEKAPEGNVFKFVDTCLYKNREKAYKELNNILKIADPFEIFGALVWGVRNLAKAKFKAPSFEKAAPFIKGKSKKQAQEFSEESVRNLISDLYKIDKAAKTGQIEPKLMITLATEKVINS